MSHGRVEHRGKSITIVIDGKKCDGVYGQTILEIARANDIYIPTMCYLTKVSPIASCRMCAVKVDGVDGLILSCQEKAVDGAVITTNDNEIEYHRTNIMKLYDVNHPLQCGVCDKSGECDLQNKNIEFKVDSQHFAAKEQPRKQKKWGVLGYDPNLCIMCEKCVHTCNEVIGSSALYIKPGGYNSTIDIKMSRCEQCGDCISVCPVGAMVSNPYKYSANAWESKQIPATCAHCSTGCALYYDVKYGKITRVKNDFEFSSLCGAGRFGFEFENKNVSTKEQFDIAVEKIKSAGTIKFNSYITNEEAFILQKLKEQLGLKLINEGAKYYQDFLRTYSSVTGKSLYTATNETVQNSDMIILLGSRVRRDNPGLKYSINMAVKSRKAEFVYMHPIDDINLTNKYTQLIKYEVGSEEAVIAMLASYLIKNKPDEYKEYFDDLDIGYLSGESSVGEEELELIQNKLLRRKNKTLIIGTDIYRHPQAQNIAKLVGLIDKYTDFNILLMTTVTNTLGVSLLCDLDEQEEGDTIGYNVSGDFTIAHHSNPDFNIPSLNQQEGTFTSMNKTVLNTNVALPYEGYCLNDLANAILDDSYENTIDYTKDLAIKPEFKDIEFDDLNNGYDKYGNDLRGYNLNSVDVEIKPVVLDEVEELSSYNGSVIYRCEPLHQFNKATAKSLLLQSDTHLRGGKSFATAAKIKSGDNIKIIYGDQVTIRKFKVDFEIKGTIALYPTFDEGLNDDVIDHGYRFKQVKIEKVEVDE